MNDTDSNQLANKCITQCRVVSNAMKTTKARQEYRECTFVCQRWPLWEGDIWADNAIM